VADILNIIASLREFALFTSDDDFEEAASITLDIDSLCDWVEDELLLRQQAERNVGSSEGP
jgi:hypothetical protein